MENDFIENAGLASKVYGDDADDVEMSTTRPVNMLLPCLVHGRPQMTRAMRPTMVKLLL
jgi:hypothetical protein